VPISSVPLDREGQIDVQALEKLPVLDEVSIGEWEEQLRGVPGVSRVAAVPGDSVVQAGVLHLSDLLPEAWGQRDGTESQESGEEASEISVTEPNDTCPAESYGGPLRVEEYAPTTLNDTLRRSAERSPDRAIKYVEQDKSTTTQSYRELIEDAERVLAGLRKLGLVPGDRALFQFKSNREFLAAFWGCVLGGMIPVPMAVAPTYTEPNSAAQKLMAAWQMLGRPIVLTANDLAPSLREFGARNGVEDFRVAAIEGLQESSPDKKWHESRPEDVAVIMLTSGSTGTPKGVRLTHSNLVARSAGSIQVNAFTCDEVTLNWMPLDHVAGILFFHLRDVYLGCDQIHCPTDLVLGDPLLWLDLIDQFRCTITFAPNFAFGLVNDRASDIEQRHWDLSSMRFVLNGAESIVARTARRFLSLLVPHGLPSTAMWPAWGMSEVSSGVTYSNVFSADTLQDDVSFVAVGRPIPGIYLRVVDDDGRVVSEGTAGHLQVKGSTLMLGYYDTELNAEAFTEDGWFRTGDLAFLRDGCLTITGRAKDVIIINSVNYYSHELEAAVEEVPGITTSFAAACPVREVGEDTDQLALFFHTDVQTDAELLELLREVRQSCVRKVGANPDYLLPIEKTSIPKTEIGKIQRPLLAKRFAAGEFDDIRKRMDVLMRNERTVPDWFFRKTWIRSDHTMPNRRGPSDIWVVFLDDEGLGTTVCRQLGERGVRCVTVERSARFERCTPDRYVIDPSDPDHYVRLVGDLTGPDLSISHTIHLWTFGRGMSADPDPAQIKDSYSGGVLSLLNWIQALAARDIDSDTCILIASSGAQPVLPEERSAYDKATVLGIVKSAPQELAWLDCRHVDLPVDDPAASATALLTEATATGPDREVAYRNGKRFVARLEKAEFAEAGRVSRLKQGGKYLLTGGLGGIGVEIARLLLQQSSARVLLVGRTELPLGNGPKGMAADHRLAAYKSLQGLDGEVRYASVDVSDLGSLLSAVEAAERDWEGTLDGVIHLAGVYEERALVDETPASFEAALRPKLLGAGAISQLLDERPDALFVGFSSVISFFGGAMVGAYASANCGLEAFVRDRRRNGNARSVCVSWSTWQDVGISRAFQGTSLLRAKGYLPVTIQQGIHSLLASLSHGDAVLYVGLDGSNAHVRRSVNTGECGLRSLTAVYTTDAASRADAELRNVVLRDRFGNAGACIFERVMELPLDGAGEIDRAALAARRSLDGRDTTLEAPATELENVIASAWRSTLRREWLDVRDNFFDLGGNSLLMAQVSAALLAGLDREVSLTEMFQYPTVRSLAEYLSQSPSGPSAELETSQTRGAKRTQKMRARRQRSHTR
jgi:acyl-CoA synthetase (AMP-forming)/AMP-acid ligase II/NAD(P)-dependent dehydrogenase (short-subunit alcohol dehydrogenase family)